MLRTHLGILLVALTACAPTAPAEQPTEDSAGSDASKSEKPDMDAGPQPPEEASKGPAATDKANSEPTAAAPKTKTVSLKDHKLPLAIELPEDAEVTASQSKDGLGGAMVSSKTVSVRVLKADARLGSIAAAKVSLQKLVKPAKSFTKEEADLLVYTRGEEELSFLVLLKQGGVTYACQSLGSVRTEAELQPGIAACRSLKQE